MKPVIVGIDPGTTSAFAVLDLHGEIMRIHSKKEMRLSELKRSILEVGKPLIVSTDKSTVPVNVEKIAASFGCKIHEPERDLTKKEKLKILSKIKIKTKNIHEKDALASAIHTYKSLSKQFLKIDSILSSLGLEYYSDKIKEMISNKTAKNIQEAIERVLKKKKIEEPILVREDNRDFKSLSQKYQKKLKELKKSHDILKIYSDRLENKVKNLEKQKNQLLEEEKKKNDEMRKKVLKDKEIKSRDIMIKQLQFELKKERKSSKIYKQQLAKDNEIQDIIDETHVPIIPVNNFSKESIMKAHREYGLKDQVVWFERVRISKRAARTLISLQPRLIIAKLDEEIEKMLKNARIPVVGLEPEKRIYYASLPEEDIRHLIKRSERKNFLQWLNKYKKRTEAT